MSEIFNNFEDQTDFSRNLNYFDSLDEIIEEDQTKDLRKERDVSGREIDQYRFDRYISEYFRLNDKKKKEFAKIIRNIIMTRNSRFDLSKIYKNPFMEAMTVITDAQILNVPFYEDEIVDSANIASAIYLSLYGSIKQKSNRSVNGISAEENPLWQGIYELFPKGTIFIVYNQRRIAIFTRERDFDEKNPDNKGKIKLTEFQKKGLKDALENIRNNHDIITREPFEMYLFGKPVSRYDSLEKNNMIKIRKRFIKRKEMKLDE